MTRGTTKHSVRIPDPLWSRVQTQAAREGVTVSDLARGLISGWLDEDDDMHDDEMGEK